MALTGFVADGHTPRERRRALASLSDAALAEQIERLVAEHAAVEIRDIERLAQFIDAPLPEVAASPFGARAVALAATAGAALVQHELRAILEWPEAICGDDAVLDDHHGVWDRGNLGIGKYQSFLQDDPLSAYNPSHMAKWTPHELLHRVGAFCWRVGMPAWELYLGARLNELVPVVLWYGVDEIARRDSDGFVRAEWSARPAVDADDLAWRTAPERWPSIAARGVALVRRSLAHFERELAAVEFEIATGRRAATPSEGLDASSDAIAYVVGHAARLADRAVERCLDRVVLDPAGRCAYVDDYVARVEELFDALLFGDIAVDWDLAHARRDARLLRDWFQRAAHLGWTTFRPCVPLLGDATAALANAERGQAPNMFEWEGRLAKALGTSEVCDVVFASGARWADTGRALALAQLAEGIGSIAPRAAAEADAVDPAWLDRFARSAAFAARAPLGDRLCAFFAAHDAFAGPSSMLDLERAIARADLRCDDAVERLAGDVAAMPDDLELALVWPSAAFVLERIAAAAFERHAESDAPLYPPPTALLIGGFNGGVSILPVWPALEEAWERLTAGRCTAAELVHTMDAALAAAGADTLPAEMPQSGDEWLTEWLDAGAIGWVLVADRRSTAQRRPAAAAAAESPKAARA